MGRQQMMPDDVRKTCIQLVRGYPRRKQEYQEKRLELMGGTPNNLVTIPDPEDPFDERKQIGVVLPSSHFASRTTEDIALRLQGLEQDPETRRMRAVEYAMEHIRRDIPEKARKELSRGILLNIGNKRKFPAAGLGMDFISERQFRREKDKFLWDIAYFLKML